MLKMCTDEDHKLLDGVNECARDLRLERDNIPLCCILLSKVTSVDYGSKWHEILKMS